MRSGSLITLFSALLLASSVPAVASPHIRRGPTAPRLNRVRATKAATHVSSPRISIAPERAAQIQAALIKAGYLSGSPTGSWDAPSQAAMEKLQADNGWQTKIVPDSRAIIKLGLGANSQSSTAAASEVLPGTNAPASTLFAGDSSVNTSNQ